MNGNLAAPMPVDADAFRRSMRLLAGAVSVVTVGDGEGRTGFTATSVTSLSAEGPTLLVSLNRSSSSWPALETSRRFCVNVLAEDHLHVAQSFSGFDGRKGAARYDGARWRQMASGDWALEDALASLDCELEEVVHHRSHAILIGLVREARLRPDADPLLYWQGAYRRIEADGPNAGAVSA